MIKKKLIFYIISYCKNIKIIFIKLRLMFIHYYENNNNNNLLKKNLFQSYKRKKKICEIF